jgi:hypothetical protein
MPPIERKRGKKRRIEVLLKGLGALNYLHGRTSSHQSTTQSALPLMNEIPINGNPDEQRPNL